MDRGFMTMHLCRNVFVLAIGLAAVAAVAASAEGQGPLSASGTVIGNVVTTYCVACHNERLKSGQLVLDGLDVDHPEQQRELWEKVLRKVRVRAMPPASSSRPRPDEATYMAFVQNLEEALDRTAFADPAPGRPPIHRLNRRQYAHAIRDLFGFKIDFKTMLPADDTGFGFDNIGDVLTVSPALFDRYLIAASKISRMAVGDPTMRPTQTTYSLPYLSLGQDERMSEALPFGSRGGIAIEHYFPLDGDYAVTVTIQRSDLADGAIIRGLRSKNQIDVRLDRRRIKTFTAGSPDTRDIPFGLGYTAEEPQSEFEVRFSVTAGTRTVGVAFNRDQWMMEGVGISRLPLTNEAYSQGRVTSLVSGRIDMGIDTVDIRGPFNGVAPSESLARQRLYVCAPSAEREDEPCARQILSAIARRAYRRPVAPAEVDTLLVFYRRGQADGSFDRGIQAALVRMLVDINFLFRMERDQDGAEPGTAYEVNDFELATRLAFFLWSSIPDDELLDLAAAGTLRAPGVLEGQVRRMLADPRSSAFVESFSGQWLTTRNITAQRPDPKIFPEFDENLRDAFATETQLFLESQLGEDRPATEILTANYTFANERLARHYGIPGVVGSHFRRVDLPDDARAGLLSHGSVLTVTSYNDRTSVVQRGKWVMDNILGTPPPPPPPSVPPLENTKVKGSLRERMEIHRKNAACASCHSVMDPLGFALENFDAVGTFRTRDGSSEVDPSGTLVDGTEFNSPATFRQALMVYQDAFLTTMMEKLLTYALGRGVEPGDMPFVRHILREAADDDYRWSALIVEIAKSTPFQMREVES